MALLINLIGIAGSGFVTALAIRWTLTLQLSMIIPFGAAIMYWFIKIQIEKR